MDPVRRAGPGCPVNRRRFLGLLGGATIGAALSGCGSGFGAGQTGRHPVTGEVGRDIREQTRNVLERIKLVLEAAGTSLDNVLTVTTHLTKREDLAAPRFFEEPRCRRAQGRAHRRRAQAVLRLQRRHRRAG